MDARVQISPDAIPRRYLIRARRSSSAVILAQLAVAQSSRSDVLAMRPAGDNAPADPTPRSRGPAVIAATSPSPRNTRIWLSVYASPRPRRPSRADHCSIATSSRPVRPHRARCGIAECGGESATIGVSTPEWNSWVLRVPGLGDVTANCR